MINREVIHSKIKNFAANSDFTDDGRNVLKSKLKQVWTQEEADNEHESHLLIKQAQELQKTKDALLDAVINPDNQDIMLHLKESW